MSRLGATVLDLCPILGPLVPLFGISGDVSAGFQNQSGFCLIYIAEVNVTKQDKGVFSRHFSRLVFENIR